RALLPVTGNQPPVTAFLFCRFSLCRFAVGTSVPRVYSATLETIRDLLASARISFATFQLQLQDTLNR
ncbi:MAG TPA: hypothetical protein VFU86_22145, partial [Terriglobales bacterium]|nr:hypothetical protein [Terriglobales bacterium]